MKYINLLIVAIFSANLVAEESGIKMENGLEFGFFSDSDFTKGQCGCWYHYPASEKSKGKVIALGEAADEAIYMIIEGEKIKVGNWKADYQEKMHSISYHSDRCQIEIHSEILNEGKYSSDFNSLITVGFNDKRSVIETFGSCGC